MLTSHLFDIAKNYKISKKKKKTIMKLEKHIEIIFPEYKAKCHANRRNSCIHRGLDEAIFAYSNFKDTIYEIELFLNEHFCNFCSVLEEN